MLATDRYTLMGNTDDQKKKPAGPPHISDLILGSLKPRTGKETSRWIAGLADDSVKEAAESAAYEQEGGISRDSSTSQSLRPSGKQTVTSFVDYLFDCFQQYEFDFNRTVMGTEFVVSIERPTVHTETVRQRFQSSESVQTFRGRISTRFWTLIIRAWNDQIDGWILPSEHIFSFRADDENYEPVLHIEPVASRDGELMWRVCDMDIPWHDMRKLAKKLFGTLIKVAKGEAQPTDKFSMRPRPGMDESAMSGPAPAATVPVMPFDDKGPALQTLHTGSMKKVELQKPEPLPAYQKPENPAQKQLTQTQKNAIARKAAEAAAAEPTMEMVVDMLNQVVGRQLEKLSAAGAEAFARQDLPGVERSFKRSTRLKELHAQMSAALMQWQQAIKDVSES